MKIKPKPLLVFFLITLILIVSWFWGGNLIASGEEGMWIYNPQKSLWLFSTPWIDFGPGYSTAAFIPRIPILFLLSLSNNIFPAWICQASLFFLLIFAGLYAMYLLTNEFFKDERINTSFFVSLFYLFNLYTMTQVWNRNIYAGMFAWSYLPSLLYLYIKWINVKKLKYLWLILASSVVFSATFVTIAFLFTVWIPIGFYLLTYFVNNWSNKKLIINAINKSFLLFLLWPVVNMWWIYPLITIGTSSYKEYVNVIKSNFDSLVGVSQYFKTEDILLLRQSYFFSNFDGRDSFWREFYSKPLIYLISVVALLLMFYGINYLFRRKNKNRWLLLGLLLLGWFVSKGTNPPFGVEFYKSMFSKIGFTMMFRNPYEKLGLLFLLPYSILLGFGFSVILSVKKIGYLISLCILFMLSFFLVWPMWSGNLYSERSRFEVPKDYEIFNSIIDNDLSDCRVLVLPLINRESSFYKWGYQGAVPTDYFFNKSVISKQFENGEYFEGMYDAFKNIDQSLIPKYLNDLNVCYIVISNDLEEDRNDVWNLPGWLNYLQTGPKYIPIKQEDELTLFKYDRNDVVGNIIVEGELLPRISYYKINPSRYVVKINNAISPFNLVLKNSYNDNWRAKINGEVITSHNRILGYANGWFINKTGSFDIEILFKTWPWE